jgi:hypothetical protein|tara:strand:- start:248 stop:880 length:633 start_codon:yes stop_codon:yes gene_type:complete
MAHGKIRVNTLTYDTGSGDVDVAVSTIPDATALNAKANKNNAALTGTPTAPTAAVSTNTTQLATTAFVVAEIADEVGTTVQAFDSATAKTDEVQRFTKPQRGDIVEYTGTSFTIDFAASNNFLLKPSGNYTIALSNLANTHGQTGSIFIEPTAAATITGSWPTTMLFVGGDAGITLTGTSGGIDRIDYIVLDDTSGSEKITCNVTTNYVT